MVVPMISSRVMAASIDTLDVEGIVGNGGMTTRQNRNRNSISVAQAARKARRLVHPQSIKMWYACARGSTTSRVRTRA